MSKPAPETPQLPVAKELPVEPPPEQQLNATHTSVEAELETVKSTMPESNGLDDIRERIRRRAEEMNLKENMPSPDEYDAKDINRNFMDQMVDDALKEEEQAKKAKEFSDGKNIIQGIWDELPYIKFEPLPTTLAYTAFTAVLVLVMGIYVSGVDYAISNFADAYLWDVIRITKDK